MHPAQEWDNTPRTSNIDHKDLAAAVAKALGLSQAAFPLADQRFAGTVVPAREKVSACAAMLATARKRLQTAESVLACVREAAAASKIAAVTEALASAEAEKTAADSACTEAASTNQQAEAALARALEPLQIFVDLNEGMQDYAKSGQYGIGGRRYSASVLSKHAKEAVEAVKSWYPAIAADVQRKAAVAPAERANRSMQAAATRSNTTANVAAAAATLDQLTQARAAASKNPPELEEALRAIDPFVKLSAALEAMEAAAKAANAVDQAAEEAAASVRAASRRHDPAPEPTSRWTSDDGSSRSSGGCQCSENYRCGYCYQMQNDAATGQGRFAPYRGPAD